MTRLLAKLKARFRRAKQIVCAHDWQDDGPAKRTCSTCGRHEWLFGRRFPLVGQPALEWKEMYALRLPPRSPGGGR